MIKACEGFTTFIFEVLFQNPGATLLAQTVKNASACEAGDQGSIPGLGSSSEEENGSPLHFSCLENSMDREAWWAIVHRIAESDTGEATQQSTHAFVKIHPAMHLMCLFLCVNYSL